MTISTLLILAVHMTYVIHEPVPFIWPSSPRVLRTSVVRASDRCTPHPPEISIPGGCLSYPPPTPGISVIFQLGWVTSGKDVCVKKKFLHYIFMRKIMFSAINEKHIFSFMLIPTFLRTFYLPCAVNVRICARGAYPISSNNSRGRLFFFSHQKGVIISNIAQWKSCPIDCFPMTSRQPYLCTKQ